MRIMMGATTYVSFLIRLWREGGPELPGATADWHGEIERIQTGQQWEFDTLDDLLSFLRRQADDPGVLCQPAGSEPNSLRRKNRVKSRR